MERPDGWIAGRQVTVRAVPSSCCCLVLGTTCHSPHNGSSAADVLLRAAHNIRHCCSNHSDRLVAVRIVLAFASSFVVDKVPNRSWVCRSHSRRMPCCNYFGCSKVEHKDNASGSSWELYFPPRQNHLRSLRHPRQDRQRA